MRSPTDAGSVPDRRPVDPARSISRLLDLGLTAAGAIGMISLCWVVASTVLGLGLVTFATGSMTPAYPAGSMALSMPVALSDLRVGDVVTVDRGADRLPITHRIVAVAASTDPRSASLRLRGDANRYEDPTPYEVTEVRRVGWRLPFGAELARLAASPLGLGLVAMIITGGFIWAVWPHDRRPHDPTPRGRATR